MGEERAKVLEMLANGTINVEEARQLLDVLDNQAEDGELEVDVDVDLDLSDLEDLKHLGALRGPAIKARGLRDAGPRVRVRPPRVVVKGFDRKIRKVGKFDQLVQLAIHGIDREFIDELKEAGIKDLTFDQVLKAGQLGVDADLLKALLDLFPDLEFDQILKASKRGVTKSFLDELKEAGLEGLEFADIIKMATYGVSPRYIKEMQESGILSEVGGSSARDKADAEAQDPEGADEPEETE